MSSNSEYPAAGMFNRQFPTGAAEPASIGSDSQLPSILTQPDRISHAPDAGHEQDPGSDIETEHCDSISKGWGVSDFFDAVAHIKLRSWGSVNVPRRRCEALDVILSTFRDMPSYDEVVARIMNEQGQGRSVNLRKHLRLKYEDSIQDFESDYITAYDSTKQFLGWKDPAKADDSENSDGGFFGIDSQGSASVVSGEDVNSQEDNNLQAKGSSRADGGDSSTTDQDSGEEPPPRADQHSCTADDPAVVLDWDYVIDLPSWESKTLRPPSEAAALELAIRTLRSHMRMPRRIQQQIDEIETYDSNNLPFDILLAIEVHVATMGGSVLRRKKIQYNTEETCGGKDDLGLLGPNALTEEVRAIQRKMVDYNHNDLREDRLVQCYNAAVDGTIQAYASAEQIAQPHNPECASVNVKSTTRKTQSSKAGKNTTGKKPSSKKPTGPLYGRKRKAQRQGRGYDTLDTYTDQLRPVDTSQLSYPQPSLSMGPNPDSLDTFERAMYDSIYGARYGQHEVSDDIKEQLKHEAVHRVGVLRSPIAGTDSDCQFEQSTWYWPPVRSEVNHVSHSAGPVSLPEGATWDIDSEDDEWYQKKGLRMITARGEDEARAYFGSRPLVPGEVPVIRPRKAIRAIAAQLNLTPIALLERVEKEHIAPLVPYGQTLLAQIWDWASLELREALLKEGSLWMQHLKGLPFTIVPGQNPYLTAVEIAERGRPTFEYEIYDFLEIQKWQDNVLGAHFITRNNIHGYSFTRFRDVFVMANDLRLQTASNSTPRSSTSASSSWRDYAESVNDLGIVNLYNPPTVHCLNPPNKVPSAALPSDGSCIPLGSLIDQDCYIYAATRVSCLYDGPDFKSVEDLTGSALPSVTSWAFVDPGLIGHYSSPSRVVDWLFQRFSSLKTRKLGLLQKTRLLQESTATPLVPDARRFCGLLFSLCDQETRRKWYELLPTLIKDLTESNVNKNPYCTYSESERLTRHFNPLRGFTIYPEPIITNFAAKDLNTRYRLQNCPWPLTLARCVRIFKLPLEEREIQLRSDYLPVALSPAELQDWIARKMSDQEEVQLPPRALRVAPSANKDAGKTTVVPTHKDQPERDRKTLAVINQSLLKTVQNHPPSDLDIWTPGTPGGDDSPIKQSLNEKLDLGWQLWDCRDYNEFKTTIREDTAGIVKNLLLNDESVVYAYKCMTAKQRTEKFGYDFDSSGRIRRLRIPKGRAPVVKDTDGTLYYLVVEGTYALKGDYGSENCDWLVSPEAARDRPADHKPVFSWGNVVAIGVDPKYCRQFSKKFYENADYCWKDVTPYQYAEQEESDAIDNTTGAQEDPIAQSIESDGNPRPSSASSRAPPSDQTSHIASESTVISKTPAISPPKPQTPSPRPKTSTLAEGTKVGTNATSQDGEAQLSQAPTTTPSQLRQNNFEEALPTMASNDPTPSSMSFKGSDTTHLVVDTMTRSLYTGLLDFCGGRDSHEYVADRMSRLIHTLRAGHSEAANPPPKSSQSLKRATPADFEHPAPLRRLQAEPSQSYSDQCGVRGTGPIPSREQAYQPYLGRYDVRNTGPMPLQEQQYWSYSDQYGVRGTEPVPLQERRFQSYPGQYGVPDTMPTDWPGSQARPPAFGQFDERDTAYTSLHSPAGFKSRNSFMQGQTGFDFSTRVEPRQNFPGQKPASVSRSGYSMRDPFGNSSRTLGVQASPFKTFRYDSRILNTDNRGQDNTRSISYDQRQLDRDQQRTYADHEMSSPAVPQSRSLHTNRTRSELASSIGTPSTPSGRRSRASTREIRDRGYHTQSRGIYRDPSMSPRRGHDGQPAQTYIGDEFDNDGIGEEHGNDRQ